MMRMGKPSPIKLCGGKVLIKWFMWCEKQMQLDHIKSFGNIISYFFIKFPSNNCLELILVSDTFSFWFNLVISFYK